MEQNFKPGLALFGLRKGAQVLIYIQGNQTQAKEKLHDLEILDTGHPAQVKD